MADVVGEVAELAAGGVLEVTLLGQNVNSYGRDLPREERATFAELLRAVAGVEGISRVRYTSPHPKDMKADVIAAMAECPEVCEHLHLPAQSGSTRVLKAMRRTYGRERYLELVTRLRDGIPDLSLTTDLIVGFPGETEDDFAQTLSLVEEVRYDGAYTFLYSPRPGTEAAASLPDDVPPEVKRERIARLVEMVQRTAAERAARFVGIDARGAGGGAVAHRPVAPARPAAPEHHRQLHRRRGGGRPRAGARRGRDLDHPVRPPGRRAGAGGPRPGLRSSPSPGRRRPARARWPTPPRSPWRARSWWPTPSSATGGSRSPPTAPGRTSWHGCPITVWPTSP